MEKVITLVEEGKDLSFYIRPMPARPMELWLEKAAQLLLPNQTVSPTTVAKHILQRGLLALACANPEQSAPLLEELLRCCHVVSPKAGAPILCSSENSNEHITKVATLLLLRRAALQVNLSFALHATRKSLVLPKESAFRRACEAQTYARTANVPQVTATLISHGMATLKELNSVYTYAQALDLLEVLSVRNYNQWAAHQAAQRKRQ